MCSQKFAEFEGGFRYSLHFCLVSFQRGSGSLSTYPVMFVQGPQIIKQRSGNSEDDSDEEGPEDVLQVNPSQWSWLDIAACFVQ
ncbi:protein sda1-like protein [Lasius niger]|uniref:Protein sda1-like protein n=1 Tax=Lasius niger TaxID=67767 RepID=A0A0J7KBH2_LASNI|nr:protein sda1-like protein [Lasius niger]